MFRTPPLLPISLILCSLGFVLAIAATLGRLPAYRPSPAEWRIFITEAAAPHIPAQAKPCGVVDLRENPSNALACVQDAMSNNLPFWVLSQDQGIDSQVWSLVIGSGSDVSAVEFDSYDWESRERTSFNWHKVSCSSLHYGQVIRDHGAEFHEAAISCNRDDAQSIAQPEPLRRAR